MGPDDVRERRRALGRRLRLFREAAGYTQHEFAPLTLYGRSTIANVETGGQRAQREFWQRCDQLLNTDGVLTADYDEITLLEQQLLAATARSSDARTITHALDDAWRSADRLRTGGRANTR